MIRSLPVSQKAFGVLFAVIMIALLALGNMPPARAAVKPFTDPCANSNYSLRKTNPTRYSSDGHYSITVSLYEYNPSFFDNCQYHWYTRAVARIDSGYSSVLCAGQAPESSHYSEVCGFFTGYGNNFAENSITYFINPSNQAVGYGDLQGHVGDQVTY